MFASLEKGQRLRVRETFYASGVPVRAGQVVQVDWVDVQVEERIYRLTVSLTPIDPPGGTILWGRDHPLDADYLAQIFEPA
jgi:hypothetical protein